MERYEFDERHERLTVGNYGDVLLLMNGRKESIKSEALDGEETQTREAWVYDGVLLHTEGKTSESAMLKAAREKKLAEIIAYDTSPMVRGMLMDGQSVWIDKDTRVGVMNSARIAKDMGESNYTLWISGSGISMPVDDAITLLCRVELYAQECYNVTASHRAVVSAMTDAESIVKFDHTAGYPEKIDISHFA